MAGYLEKRGNNCWRFVVSGGKDANGARIKHTKIFHGSPKEADLELARFVTECSGGNYIKGNKLYVREFLELWLKDYAKPNVEAQTYERYEQLLRKYAYDSIGKYKLEQVKTPHFQKLYTELTSVNKLSGTTVLQLHRILHKAFKTACEWQMLNKNPVENVKPPKKSSPDIVVLDEAQSTLLLEKAQEEPLQFYALIALTLISGFRRNEVLAVRWQDVNFEKNTITVNQALQRVTGEGVSFKKPKTKSSLRTIHLADDILQLISQLKIEQNKHRLAMGDKWKNNDLLFPGLFGQPQSPDHVSHLFKEFINNTELPQVTLHGLRHYVESYVM